MGSKWRKVKLALGLNLCVYGPRNHVADNDDDEDSMPPAGPPSERRSDAALLSPPGDWTSAPATPASNRLRLSKSLSRSSSKKTCSICLASMRRGDGQAIFTAECSHSFHFQCIASNVKHGNQICPVCRAKWKEIPLQGPSLDPPLGRARINPVDWPQNNDMMTVIRRLPPPRSNSSRHVAPLFQAPEPAIFNDDESLDHETDSTEKSFTNKSSTDCDDQRKVNIKTYTEVSAVPKSSRVDSFTVLLHLKAPCSDSWHNLSRNDTKLPKISQTPRAPVDLVTVLDISGSMAGTKLALLKRAMGFVIQNLGPNDRLAVIAFSSTARRLFPLRRMSETGRQQALLAVNSLVANGGTNIAEGLRKGAKIMEDRREKNPVASIILLSDGQDTYTVNNTGTGGGRNVPDYQLLLPLSIRPDETSGFKIPVHAFGFGVDHDASSMHSISETSGGTFSFIETEGVIQDAFAQCIGGLLSVVVKDLHVRIECVHPTIHLGSLKAGSYPNRVLSNQRIGSIDVGDLYADEERDFLISINVPTDISSNETSLLKVKCIYNDPLTKELVTLEVDEVRVKRTDVAIEEDISIEVDRQQNRIKAAEAMAQARIAAENGDLAGAVSILENTRRVLAETVSAKSNDRLCVALDAELKEMQERMASRHVYEASGRAYILSGLSSHSWQRATARGDSIDGSSLVGAYQTPSMVEMVTRSQATLLGSPSTQRLLRPVWSFASHPKPR
ncbi:Anaphase-promoting complex (APC), subunit 11 [Handroanthus impetiginosus]|uniref:Anaphase-promoting complex (APC), subunit 11 n=1 Tax=Handroanthus impetiginosus TaxID=429701 RepID=A0A2G9GTD7_9LAMI|nr:Anaphase-promoting complex (APC), subunit 11 [Handroanthus impetiginosus]